MEYIVCDAEVFDHRLEMPNGREAVSTRMSIVAVEIATGQSAAIVADDHAIRVEHRHDLEYKLVPQLLSNRKHLSAGYDSHYVLSMVTQIREVIRYNYINDNLLRAQLDR